jgi:hypothetical protein
MPAEVLPRRCVSFKTRVYCRSVKSLRQVSPGLHVDGYLIQLTTARNGRRELVEEGFSMGLAMALASESDFAFRTWIR